MINLSASRKFNKQTQASGMVNDLNPWSYDPRYIVELVKRVVRVSMETTTLVNSLPKLNLENGLPNAMEGLS